MLCALLAATIRAPAADLDVSVHDADGVVIDEAVVALYGDTAATPAAPAVHTMDQVNKQFVPRLLAVRAGDQVRFPNSDDIRHHVYSFSPAMTFELPLYRGTPSAPLTFPVPGKVVLGCNIHDRMAAHIYVLDAPRFAVTTQGHHTFRDVAPGDYAVAVFHPRLAAADDGARHAVTIAAQDNPPLDLVAPVSAPRPLDDSSLSPLERKFQSLRRGTP